MIMISTWDHSSWKHSAVDWLFTTVNYSLQTMWRCQDELEEDRKGVQMQLKGDRESW